MLSVRIYVLFVVIVIYANFFVVAILRNIYGNIWHRKEMNVYRVTPRMAGSESQSTGIKVMGSLPGGACKVCVSFSGPYTHEGCQKTHEDLP